jgi:hypothetical protein
MQRRPNAPTKHPTCSRFVIVIYYFLVHRIAMDAKQYKTTYNSHFIQAKSHRRHITTNHKNNNGVPKKKKKKTENHSSRS